MTVPVESMMTRERGRRGLALMQGNSPVYNSKRVSHMCRCCFMQTQRVVNESRTLSMPLHVNIELGRACLRHDTKMRKEKKHKKEKKCNKSVDESRKVGNDFVMHHTNHHHFH